MCHHRIHHDTIADQNASNLLIKWHKNESSATFQSQVSNSQCPVFCMCSWKYNTIECNLCHGRIHNDEIKECTAWCEDFDADWDTNFYCQRFLDDLVKRCNAICEEKTVDWLINWLSSFNLGNALHDETDADVFILVIEKAIDECDSVSNINSILSLGATTFFSHLIN